jgi:hypothetical protein
MSLDKLKEKVGEAIENLVTLEIASFTGKPSGEININGDNLFESIKNSLATTTLVGYSRFELDGDAINYTNSDLGEGKEDLVTAHTALVQSAKDSREKLFDFALTVLGAKKD